jgi:peptide deformylase
VQELKVLTFPEPMLRKKARKVEKVRERERAMLDDMASAMYLSQGVGLAAVQVGIDSQLAVIDTGTGLIKMVNPVIVKASGSQSQEEGCLSCPGASVKVKRSSKVVVSYLDENGEMAELRADGLLARAVQHEIDHLRGKLIIDYLGPLKKMLFGRRRKGAKRS